jgi:hypothetical protein
MGWATGGAAIIGCAYCDCATCAGCAYCGATCPAMGCPYCCCCGCCCCAGCAYCGCAQHYIFNVAFSRAFGTATTAAIALRNFNPHHFTRFKPTLRNLTHTISRALNPRFPQDHVGLWAIWLKIRGGFC